MSSFTLCTNHHPTADEIPRSFPLTTVLSTLCQLSQQNQLNNMQNQNKLSPLNSFLKEETKSFPQAAEEAKQAVSLYIIRGQL